MSCEGYLFKQGGGKSLFGRQTWKRRYVVLTSKKLYYFKNKSNFSRQKQIKAPIDISLATITKHNETTIIIETYQRVLRLRTSNAGQFSLWWDALQGTEDVLNDVRETDVDDNHNSTSSTWTSSTRRGWMKKRGGGGAWQSRWFVLHSGMLSYFGSEKERQLRGSIELYGCTIQPKDVLDITISHPNDAIKKTYMFRTASVRERNDWLAALSMNTTIKVDDEKIENSIFDLNDGGLLDVDPLFGLQQLADQLSAQFDFVSELQKSNEKEVSTEVIAKKEGWLKKLGGSSHKTWQNRWFILEQGVLAYYENASGRKLKGSISLFGCEITETNSTTLRISHPENLIKKPYELKCPDHTSHSEWLSLLTANCKIENIKEDGDNKEIDFATELDELLSQCPITSLSLEELEMIRKNIESLEAKFWWEEASDAHLEGMCMKCVQKRDTLATLARYLQSPHDQVINFCVNSLENLSKACCCCEGVFDPIISNTLEILKSSVGSSKEQSVMISILKLLKTLANSYENAVSICRSGFLSIAKYILATFITQCQSSISGASNNLGSVRVEPENRKNQRKTSKGLLFNMNSSMRTVSHQNDFINRTTSSQVSSTLRREPSFIDRSNSAMTINNTNSNTNSERTLQSSWMNNMCEEIANTTLAIVQSISLISPEIISPNDWKDVIIRLLPSEDHSFGVEACKVTIKILVILSEWPNYSSLLIDGSCFNRWIVMSQIDGCDEDIVLILENIFAHSSCEYSILKFLAKKRSLILQLLESFNGINTKELSSHLSLITGAPVVLSPLINNNNNNNDDDDDAEITDNKSSNPKNEKSLTHHSNGHKSPTNRKQSKSRIPQEANSVEESNRNTVNTDIASARVATTMEATQAFSPRRTLPRKRTWSELSGFDLTG
eukprot:TRINITY_DN368762_c0_g2_i1.p1 TRINITY_DN368762_c0_g2~~TRINITY_DN368762_c0_g2_i1.p1  ORF type:complete len:898 (+),score=221.23 TRINITY_DN368762_c0_g2_i1:97-2790(+)